MVGGVLGEVLFGGMQTATFPPRHRSRLPRHRYHLSLRQELLEVVPAYAVAPLLHRWRDIDGRKITSQDQTTDGLRGDIEGLRNLTGSHETVLSLI